MTRAAGTDLRGGRVNGCRSGRPIDYDALRLVL